MTLRYIAIPYHQAAVAFQTLYKLCGSEAVDAVVPVLLDQVSDDTSGNHEKVR